jgi:branched-chain amino acid transport system permease protein
MLNQILTLFLDGILMGSIYALFSLGLSLLWGVMGIINAAHGEMYTMGALLVIFLSYYVNPLLAILLVVPIMFALGIIIDQAIFRQLRRTTPIEKMAEMSIIVTIALSIFMINLYLAILGGDFWRLSPPLVSGSINILGIEYPLARVLIAGISILVTAVLYFFLNVTRSGKAIRAVSQDKEKAMMVGVSTERIYAVTWGIGALLAGLAGALVAPLYVTHPLMGTAILLYGFVVTQVGGMGSLTGTFVASYIIAILTQFAGFYISNVYKEAFAFIFMIGVLLFKGEGLFAKS